MIHGPVVTTTAQRWFLRYGRHEETICTPLSNEGLLEYIGEEMRVGMLTVKWEQCVGLKRLP